MNIRSTRGRGRGRRSLVALLAATGLAIAACGGDDDDTTSSDAPSDGTEAPADASDAPAAGSGGTLRVAHPTAPSALDPMQGNSGFDHIYIYPIFDTLVNWTFDTLEPIPGLAESWEFTDPTTLMMTLREDVMFHDDTPFNAEAVKYNLDRAMTSEFSNIAGDLASVETVEVISDYVVQLNLLNPDTALPLILSDRAGMMVSPTAAEAAGADFSLAPVGSGPFVFDEWLTGDVVTMNRNDSYWGEAPSLDRIEFSIMTDADTRLNAVLSGEQDFAMTVNPQDLERVEATEGVTASVSPGLYHDELYLNKTRPPFDDVRVRQAFNYAIDRAALNEAKQFGAGQEAWLPLPPEHWAFPEELVPSYPYDPEKARELLAEAGYADGLSFTVVGWSNAVDIRHAEIIQSQLNEVGMTMEVTATEVPPATAAFFDEQRYDAYLAAWTGRPDPALTYTLLFSKDGYFNAGGVEAEGIEALIQATREVDDQTERAEAFAALTQEVVDQALYVPLTFPPDLSVLSDAVQGYEPNLLAKPKLAYVSLNG